MRTIVRLHAAPVTLAMLLLSCSSEANHGASRAPDRLDDGWEVAAPAQFGADVGLLDSLLAGIEAGQYTGIHSVLIVKEEALDLEAYFDGYDRSTPHQIRSATKSIGSILTGIAIDKGFTPDRVTGYWASGNGGQYIIVLPDNQMVVVFTGGNYNSELANQPFEMLAPFATSTVAIDDGGLRLLSPDDEWIYLVPHSPTFFTGQSHHGPLTFVFEMDTNGRAIRHTVYGGFQRFVLERD